MTQLHPGTSSRAALWCRRGRDDGRPNQGGSIDQLPSGRWRLRVRLDGRQVTQGMYETEETAFGAQARWRLKALAAGG